MPCLSFSLVDLETISQLLLKMDSDSETAKQKQDQDSRCVLVETSASVARTVGTSVDEQDVVLVDWSMNHV